MEDISQKIQERATELGFIALGVTYTLPQDTYYFEKWLASGFNGQMSYLERHLPVRKNPENLLKDAKSIIVVAHPYTFPAEDEINPFIARYSRGIDYHIVIKEKLDLLAQYIKELIPTLNFRTFVDTCPLDERQLAVQAGIGKIGKNGLVYLGDYGSAIHLGEIITDIELSISISDDDILDCGNCTLCIDNCPSNAMRDENNLCIAKDCYAYKTIELRDEEIDVDGEYIFGCDICQRCCPHNSDFFPLPQDRSALERFIQLSEDEFNVRFKHSPLLRAGYKKLISQAKKKLLLP